MADVKFILDADSAKAVKGILKVMEANKKTEKSFNKSVKAGRRFDRGLKSLKSTALGVAGSFIGAAGITLAVGSMTSAFKDAIQKTIKFEEEMTGLLSLGENVQNIDDIKDSVLNMSSAFGISRKEIADAMFNLQSGASSLSESIREDVLKEAVELSKVTGTDLPTALTGLLKTFLIYQDELGTVNQAQNVLFKTAELGFLTFQDLAVLFPDVAASAKSLGFGINDVSASLIVATQLGGKNEKTFTGIRNVFLRMQKAIDGNLVPATGTFLEQLEALSRVDPQEVVKVFGIEAATAISNLVQNTSLVNENLKIMKNLSGDVAKTKLFTRLLDPAFGFAEISKSIKQATENVPLTRDIATGAGKLDIDIALRKLAFRKKLPEELAGLAGPLALLRTFDPFQFLFPEKVQRRGVTAGQDILLEQIRAGGQAELAELTSIRLGRKGIAPGGDIRPGGTPGTITGEEGAQRFLELQLKALERIESNTAIQSGAARSAHTE